MRMDYNDSNGFEIQASSRTLVHNEKDQDAVLWRPGTRYIVPIFQRAYSWGQSEVSQLVNDLLDSYTGRHGGIPADPMFIGTMQIDSQERCPGAVFESQHKIIDGQQRISTLILLLRAIELAGVNQKGRLPADYTQRLITHVGGGIQQSHLEAALRWDGASPFSNTDLNQYHQNLVIIRNLLTLSHEDAAAIDIEGFADYLLSKVYFVVIETRAGLSKTLQIFKAINTTGLDLGGGDVFKIRFFEYLRFHDKDSSSARDQEIFSEVAKLYDEIDRRNDKAGQRIAEMEHILSLARHYVTTEADLAHAARLTAGTTFFDHFFDVVINRQTRSGFAREKCNNFSLSLDLFRELIDVRFKWDEPGARAFGAEATIMDDLIWWGRYGSYYEVLFLFCHRFRPTEAQIERFTIVFSKLLSTYSLIFERITEPRKTFLHDLLKRFSSKSGETVDSITQHVEALCAAQRGDVLWALKNRELAHLSTKGLICRLSAMLEEPDFPAGSADSLYSKLFETEIDIEHIEPCNHLDESKREGIWKEWGAELNSLGNLIVLERPLNRGSEVSNHGYAVKREAYKKSRFATVRILAEKHEDWDLDKAKDRKEALANKITNYLCGPEVADHSDS